MGRTPTLPRPNSDAAATEAVSTTTSAAAAAVAAVAAAHGARRGDRHWRRGRPRRRGDAPADGAGDWDCGEAVGPPGRPDMVRYHPLVRGSRHVARPKASPNHVSCQPNPNSTCGEESSRAGVSGLTPERPSGFKKYLDGSSFSFICAILTPAIVTYTPVVLTSETASGNVVLWTTYPGQPSIRYPDESFYLTLSSRLHQDFLMGSAFQID